MQNASDHFDSWMPMSLQPPVPCETFEVLLTDGSVVRAFWTGRKWLLRGQDLQPRQWRIFERAA